MTPKLTYVMGFEPWGWVIGTGTWMDDVNDEFMGAVMTYSLAGLLAIRGYHLAQGQGERDDQIGSERQRQPGERSRDECGTTPRGRPGGRRCAAGTDGRRRCHANCLSD